MGTNDDNERDPMIARALGQVPVPPRPPDFLDRLDDALDAVDEERRSPAPATPTTHSGETVPVELTDPRSDNDVADLSARRQQKTGRRYRVLAAAASVAVILGGVAVLTRDDGTTTVTPAGENPGTTSPAAADPRTTALRDAMETVMTWSEAVSDRDGKRAWSLMGPLSQAYLTEQGGWDEMFAGMGEGSFGKWHVGGMPTSLEGSAGGAGEDQGQALSGENKEGHQIRSAFLPNTTDAVVVSLTGVFELEGNVEKALDAFPVVRDGADSWRIEPFAFGPGETFPEFLSPALAEGGGLTDVERGFTLEVVAVAAKHVAALYWAPDAPEVAVPGAGEFHEMKPASAPPAGSDARWTDPASSDLPGGDITAVVVSRGADFIVAHPVEFFVRAGDPVNCPNIGFTPNSDDVASGITISGGTCANAEALVRHVHEELNHNFFDGPRYFTARDDECTVRTESEGLESGLYRCADGAKLVRWRKT